MVLYGAAAMGRSLPNNYFFANMQVDRTKSDTGLCSGRDPFNTLLVDSLAVPDVAPGPYVLSLRWDCEKSAQVG